MKKYIGTKIINAKPMTRLEYNCFRGWDLPADENPDDEGFLVEYTDGGKANTKEFAGYVSWSPKEVFEKAYIATDSIPNSMSVESIESVVEGAIFKQIDDTTTTLCILTLKNGYVVIGQSACIDKNVFDFEVGKEIAYEDAFGKIWELEGYLLAQRRFEAGVTQ